MQTILSRSAGPTPNRAAIPRSHLLAVAFSASCGPDVGPGGTMRHMAGRSGIPRRHCAQVARPTEAEAELENDGADELPASAQYQAGQPTTVFQ